MKHSLKVKVNLTLLPTRKKAILNGYRPSYGNGDGELRDCQIYMPEEQYIGVGGTKECEVNILNAEKFGHTVGDWFCLYEGDKIVANCEVLDISEVIIQDWYAEYVGHKGLYPSPFMELTTIGNASTGSNTPEELPVNGEQYTSPLKLMINDYINKKVLHKKQMQVKETIDLMEDQLNALKTEIGEDKLQNLFKLMEKLKTSFDDLLNSK